jgi:hypothetical protein
MKLNEAEIERKQSDIKDIIDDAITSLVMQGLTNQGALRLLMTQCAVRMDDAAQVRSELKFIEGLLVDDDLDDA